MIELAVRAYRARNFVEARARFARANALYPNARTLRGLGMVEFELGNYVDCVVLLRRALESGERPLRAQLRQDTLELLVRAQTRVAELSIQSNVPLSEVLVDGRSVDISGGRTLVVAAGAHELEFRSEDDPPQRMRFRVAGGEHKRLRVMFPGFESEPTMPPSEPSQEASSDDGGVLGPNPFEEGAQAPKEEVPQTAGESGLTPETGGPEKDQASQTPNTASDERPGEFASGRVPPAAAIVEDEPPAEESIVQRATSRDEEVLGVGADSVLHSEEFEADDPLRIGGELLLRIQATGLEKQPGARYGFSAPSLLDVYFDARPNDRVRAFVLGRLAYDPTRSGDQGEAWNSSQAVSATGGLSGSADLSELAAAQAPAAVALDQLWIRFDLYRTVFVNAGKQHVRWGTARFWMPTDYLHVRRRNPLDVFDARLGTTMLKLHLPIESRSWNFYAFGVLENEDATVSLGQIAGAARAEIVFGTTELAAGVFYRKHDRPKFAADISTSLGPLDLYADVAVLATSKIDRIRHVRDPMIPPEETAAPWVPSEQVALARAVQIVDLTYPTYRRAGYHTQVAAGLTYAQRYRDNDSFTVGAEYFYNQLGYDDAKVYPGLLLPHSRPLNDAASLFYLGKHYAAAYLSLPAPGSLDRHTFTLSTLGNISDRSFLTRLDYSLQMLTHLRFDAFVSVRYGEARGEFRLGIPPLDLGGFVIERSPAIVDLGLSLRVAL